MRDGTKITVRGAVGQCREPEVVTVTGSAVSPSA